MARLYDTMLGNAINLDQVARVVHARAKDKDGKWVTEASFYTADAKCIGREEHREPDLDELTAPVVPAAPGAKVVLLCIYDDEERPAAVEVWDEPIVAWRIQKGALSRFFWGAAPRILATYVSSSHCPTVH